MGTPVEFSSHEPLGHNEELGPARTRAISMTRKYAILVCATLVLAGADSARAADSDPAATQVQTLTASLLKSMQAGAAVSMTERYRDLEPVIEQAAGTNRGFQPLYGCQLRSQFSQLQRTEI